jgi:hypothetical protein
MKYLLVIFLVVGVGFPFVAGARERLMEWEFQEILGLEEDSLLEGPSPVYVFYFPAFSGILWEQSDLVLSLNIPQVLHPLSKISVYAENILLFSENLTRRGERTLRIPLNKLSQVPQKDAYRFEIRSHLFIGENPCEDLASGNLWISVGKESRFRIVMEEVAWNLQDFFRFPAQNVTVFLPQDFRSKDMEGAYIKLYAFLRRAYRGLPVRIVTRLFGGERLPEEAPGEKRIFLMRESLRDVHLFGRTLYLTPKGVEAVVSEKNLVSVSSQVVESVFLPLSSRKKTLADFGVGDTTVRGIGNMGTQVCFALSDLGGAWEHLSLVLFWASAPLPQSPRGEAFLRVFLNGNPIFSERIVEEKSLPQRSVIPLPPANLARENTLEIVFSYFPEVENCRRGIMPFEATIFGNSYFVAYIKKDVPSLLTFGDVPTLFWGKGWVVLPENPALEELEAAARLYGALREMDNTPLFVEVAREKELPGLLGGRKGGRLLAFPRSFQDVLRLFSEIALLFRQGTALLFSSPSIPEYLLLVSPSQALLRYFPVSVAQGALSLTSAPLPLTTLKVLPDEPLGVLTLGRVYHLPALAVLPCGTGNVAFAHFLRGFEGARTLRRLKGNVVVFGRQGWSEDTVGWQAENTLLGFFRLYRFLFLALALGVVLVFGILWYARMARSSTR